MLLSARLCFLVKVIIYSRASRYAMFLSVVKLNQLNDYNFFSPQSSFIYRSHLLTHTLRYQFNLQTSHKKALQSLAVPSYLHNFDTREVTVTAKAPVVVTQMCCFSCLPSFSLPRVFWKLHIRVNCLYVKLKWVNHIVQIKSTRKDALALRLLVENLAEMWSTDIYGSVKLCIGTVLWKYFD